MLSVMRRSMIGFAVLVSTIVTVGAQAPSTSAGQRRAMTLVDVINVPRLSDPQLSPDGRQVLYVRSDADWKGDRRVTHIWRVNVDGSGPLQLTHGPEGESSPRWSPDGRAIAFVSRRPVSGEQPRGAGERGSSDEDRRVAQIFRLANDGGEARPLTSHATSVSDIAWAPDGKAIYFTADEPKADEERSRERLRDDVYAFDENYQQQHLWRVGVDDRTEQRITQGAASVLSYRLSRDGRRIALHRAPSPLLGDGELGEVWVMDASGQNATQLTKNRVPENGATLSPDNAQVLFVAQANAQFENYYNRKIFLVPASGGAVRVLNADQPYEVEQADWGRDGRSIFFVANLGVHSELFEVDATGGTPRQLTDGRHAIDDWRFGVAAGRHVLRIDDATNAGDVYALGAGAQENPVRVTHVYDALAREFRLPRQEAIQWKGADGVPVEGLLYYPLDYAPGQRYPLVVQTHGGPQSSDKFGFGSWSNYVPVLAAKGYFVLKPNYRGSTGYGDAFLRDMVGSYFRNAHLDVMAGVDHVITLGLVDGERMAKMGWSGGGHMTNKIITFTNRFKAASSGAGAANWISMYAQSDVRTFRTPWFGGTPWQKDAPIEKYWDNSPLKYVGNVTTPTIFLVGERDPRVPMPQSIEMYRALKSNGVPTRLYVAPREPHGWQELRHQLFKTNVELEWFERYVTKRPYVWEKAPDEAARERATTSQP